MKHLPFSTTIFLLLHLADRAAATTVGELANLQWSPLRLQSASSATHTRRPEGFSACLLNMDDNFRLIEWIAYHYHTMPLRRLIVLADPRSKTSPTAVLERWSNSDLVMEQWSEEDIFDEDQLADRTEEGLIEIHRGRQRAFNVKCMAQLREEGYSWTMMTDVDEYTYVNPRARDPEDPLYVTGAVPQPLDESGSVLDMLEKIEAVGHSFPSPCLPLPRLQFGMVESLPEEVEQGFPSEDLSPWLEAGSFDTFRWRHYGNDTVTARYGALPGKTLIDLSRIKDDEVELFSGDPHRPIEKICDPKSVWSLEHESLFLSNHVLGTVAQYTSREDSRLMDRIMSWESRKNVRGEVSDEIRVWLDGFIRQMGPDEARRLLEGVGQVPAKVHNTIEAASGLRCSLNFFGLPRSFKTMVLPSLIENVLIPNAKYNCDIFVHYYQIEQEEEGRLNRGGEIDSDSIIALEAVAEVVAAFAGQDPPNVVIVSETKEEFSNQFGHIVSKYQTKRDPETGKLVYFPWADKSYTSEKQIENVVMQWNSIQKSWNAMMSKSYELGVEYDRVGFFRSDAFYATRIDIFQTDKDTYDFDNQFAVVPGFGKHPVNDRMIYGPKEAVRIWATERFHRLDHHIATYSDPGYGMHSERYLAHEIFPAIKDETGIKVVENVDICFYRTRAGETVLVTDCDDKDGGVTRGIRDIDQVFLVENLVRRPCEEFPLDKNGRFVELRCDDDAKTRTVVAGSRRYLQVPPATESPVPPATASPTIELFPVVETTTSFTTALEGITPEAVESNLSGIVDVLETAMKNALDPDGDKGLDISVVQIGDLTVRSQSGYINTVNSMDVKFEIVTKAECASADECTDDDVSSSVDSALEIADTLKEVAEDDSLTQLIAEEANEAGLSELSEVTVQGVEVEEPEVEILEITAFPSSVVTAAPTSLTTCSDSPFRFDVMKDDEVIRRSCSWVASAPLLRCKYEGVSSHCQQTCGSCDICADSSLKFKVTHKGKEFLKGCEWAGRKNVKERCAIDGISETCRLSCGICTTPPTSTPSCVDSSYRFDVRLNGKMKKRSCSWVANNPVLKCKIWKVPTHCPQTCSRCDECTDSLLKFQAIVKGNEVSTSCKWVGRKDVKKRCSKGDNTNTCRSTCEAC